MAFCNVFCYVFKNKMQHFTIFASKFLESIKVLYKLNTSVAFLVSIIDCNIVLVFLGYVKIDRYFFLVCQKLLVFLVKL